MDRIIMKSKVLPCNLSSLWWKWTTHEGLLTFFGPDNKIVLMPGGDFEIYFLMDNPLGLRGGEGCKILSFLPEQMLSFTWNAPPEFPEIRNHDHKTWVVVNFRSLDESASEIVLHHLGWLEGKEWDQVFNYFETAWELVLQWLEKSCQV
jgi:uncharacterized protein YndB with AHSA1/START domain